jgi:hypothetical protein
MVLISVVIGAATAAAATDRVTVSLVISGALGWSFVPVLQLLTGLILIQGSRGGRWRQLERYFELHWPWSLWILAYHAALLLLPTRTLGTWLALTGVVPLLITVRLLLQFTQNHVTEDRRAAIRRVVLHQAVTYSVFLAYAAVAVALWTRVLKVLA